MSTCKVCKKILTKLLVIFMDAAHLAKHNNVDFSLYSSDSNWDMSVYGTSNTVSLIKI